MVLGVGPGVVVIRVQGLQVNRAHDLNVPSCGIVTGERVGFIVVSSGQECLESPLVWMLPQSLNELHEGIRVRVGELEGQRGSGKASPTPHEAFRREESEVFAHSGLHRHGHQQVKLRGLVDLSEEFLGEVLCVGQDEHAGALRLQHGMCQLEQCRGGL